jgi:hypothetical protein
MAEAGEARQAALEPAGEAPGGEPEVERGVDQRGELLVVEDAARRRYQGLAGVEFRGCQRGRPVAADQLEDLGPQRAARVRSVDD